MGDLVTLVSSSEEAAKDVYRVLADRGELCPERRAEHSFRTTGDPEVFRRLARRFLGPEVDNLAVERDRNVA